MRVLIHTPFFHPTVGGMELFTDGLAEELTRFSINVHVVAETPLQSSRELERPYKITRASYDRDEVVSSADVILAVGPSVKLLSTAYKQGVPFVLKHAAPAGVCPVGIGWRNAGRCDFNLIKCLGCRVAEQSVATNLRGIARMYKQRWAMRRAAANVFVSSTLADRTPWCSGHIIGNFFNPNVFRPDPEGITNPNFLFVGRLVSVKGADILIRGFAHARRRGMTHSLVLVGSGPDRAQLESLAAAEGVADVVEFVGTKQGAELAQLMRSAYALAFPSQWEEPFGIVMAEAMGSGCPVVASRRGSCPEVIGDAGMLVDEPENPTSWADALFRLAAAPALRRKLSLRSTARAVELYTLRAVATRYFEVFTKAVRVTPHAEQPS